MDAVLLVSHGSRSSKTKDEIISLVKKLKIRSKIPVLEYAFLEIESPSIPEGIDDCIKKGATRVIVLLNFLNAGRHVDTDIPKIITDARIRYPNVPIIMSDPVGQEDGIIDLFLKMILKT